MLSSSSSTRRKLIGAFGAFALLGATAAAIPSVNAQQLAATEAGPDLATYLEQSCAKYKKDPGSHSQCFHNKAIEFQKARGAAAEKKIEAADKQISEGDCAIQLKSGLTNGTLSQEVGRKILNGKKPSEYGTCKLLHALTRS